MNKKKMKEDIMAYAVVLLFSLFFLFYAIPTQISVPKAAVGLFTPRTYPYVCFAVIAVCSVAGLLKSIVKYVRESRSNPEFSKGIQTWKEKTRKEKIGAFMPWICIALCILYAILFGKIGFILSTILIAPIILFILGDKKILHYVYVYAFCAVMYVIFVIVLGVRLP